MIEVLITVVWRIAHLVWPYVACRCTVCRHLFENVELREGTLSLEPPKEAG